MLKNWPLILLGIAIICVATAVGYKSWTIHVAKNDIYSTAFNEFSGPADAPIKLVEFIDYRCSACRMKHDDLKILLAKNSDLQIIYRHYPVFGAQAADEAAMVLAASLQGKFAEAHEYFISRETPVKTEDMPLMIHELGLDRNQFMGEWRSPEIGIQLIKNMDNAKTLGVNSTPTFFIDKQRVGDGGSQMPSIEELQAAIDKAREN